MQCKLRIAKNLENLGTNNHNTSTSDIRIIKGFSKKDCFYLKADKRNKIVILNKSDYFARVNNLLLTESYTQTFRKEHITSND